MTTDEDEGRYWPVVAEFFVSILAVFVVLSSAVSQPTDGKLASILEDVKADLTDFRKRGLLDDYQISDREVLMIYSTQYLGFESCSWALDSDKAREVKNSVKVLERLGTRVDRLSIEGHADDRRPAGCKQMKFGTNFELSQNRAMAVFGAMLGEPIDRLDDVVREARDTKDDQSHGGLVWMLTGRQRIVVAGYGATRPRVPDNPEDKQNRRVELRAVLRRSDQ